MSNCIKDLYEKKIIKKRCRCKNFLLKSNLHKNKNRKDGFEFLCKNCVKDCSLKKNDKIFLKTKYWNKNNPEKVKENQKKYNEWNKEKRNVYLKNKREPDVLFSLISNTRNKIF